MIRSLSRRQVLAVVLVLALVLSVGGVAAYTTLFVGGAGSAYESPSGLKVTTGTDHDVSGQNPALDSNTIEIDNVTFSASGTAAVTADQFEGTRTNLSSIDASSNDITINPGDKSQVTVSGGVTELSFEDATLDGTQQLTYSASSSGTITVTGLPANTQFGAITTSGEVVGDGTTSSSGTADISVSSATDEDIILLEPSAPSPDNSEITPENGSELTEQTVELSVALDDADFDVGDEVDATFYLDGSQIDTTTVTSNGTVSTTTTITEGGTHEWHVEFTDSFGLTNETDADASTSGYQPFTFQSPGQLSVRKELAPDELVTDAQINITAYYGDETLRKSTSDGTINLTDGFPIDEPIVVRATAENYTTRTAIIESIYQQSDIYLLNNSEPTYQVRFDLQDPTGNYPRSETVLFVERDLNRSGNVTWQVIAGDNFGVQGVPTELAQDERYRLRIKNLESGQTATIGAYTAIQSETVTLSPGSATIEIPTSERQYQWSAVKNRTGQHILVQYKDSEQRTDSVKITIHERFNKSNVLVDNTTFTGTNDLVYQVPLTANQTNTSWMAEIYIDRGNGTEHYRQPVTGPTRDIIPVDLSQLMRSAIGVFVLLITSMAFSELSRSTGAVATALVGGLLWQLGLLSTIAIGPVVVLAIGISVIYHYRGGEI